MLEPSEPLSRRSRAASSRSPASRPRRMRLSSHDLTSIVLLSVCRTIAKATFLRSKRGGELSLPWGSSRPNTAAHPKPFCDVFARMALCRPSIRWSISATPSRWPSPFGRVFDIEKVEGGLIVRPARGDERYDTFSGTIETPEPGEIIFADDAGRAHARRWTNRQSAISPSGQPQQTPSSSRKLSIPMLKRM